MNFTDNGPNIDTDPWSLGEIMTPGPEAIHRALDHGAAAFELTDDEELLARIAHLVQMADPLTLDSSSDNYTSTTFYSDGPNRVPEDPHVSQIDALIRGHIHEAYPRSYWLPPGNGFSLTSRGYVHGYPPQVPHYDYGQNDIDVAALTFVLTLEGEGPFQMWDPRVLYEKGESSPPIDEIDTYPGLVVASRALPYRGQYGLFHAAGSITTPTRKVLIMDFMNTSGPEALEIDDSPELASAVD